MNQLYPLFLGNMAQVVRCVHTQGRVPSLTTLAGQNNSVKNYLIEFAWLLIRFLKARVRKKGVHFIETYHRIELRFPRPRT